MTLKKWSLLAFAVALIAPMSASALGISIANVSTAGPLDDGDSITFDLLLSNTSGEALIGLDVGVFGYDRGAVGAETDNYLAFAGAQSGAGAFGTIFSSGNNVLGLGADAPQQEFGNPITFNERYVRLFGGLSTTPVTGDGSFDSGIDGGQTNGGDVHLQVTFSAQSLGATPGAPATVDLVFGIGQKGFDVQGTSGSLAAQWTNATYTVTIVPEPGTALLMGLGLAGLASIRRR
jgi:hypothetical protein